jgi:bifunctional DNA-binding transcriptional regulator/antitoxin component of YhaV-PrlF toxin-antitoxin module
VSADGHVVIPQEWSAKLEIRNGSLVEMELNAAKVVTIKKKVQPLEIEDNLFSGVNPFTEEELEEAKASLFPKK